ncbi:hypothetical protein L2E82_11852 [Cichorium intybus]|uniref:Uncharacterized protein n=1 Tax=Cichorium intybus TaxID=13427 RepID=A0ACB9GFP7_CICIN|nr:hypothetical protein L2E82_11852 [Cichorium intybus]
MFPNATVSEVEGKLFNPCRLDKVGDYNHSLEREVVGDSEEETDWESNDSFSDEDLLIKSDEGTRAGFSDEDDEQSNHDDDADSVSRESVFEDALYASSTHATIDEDAFRASPTHAGEKKDVVSVVRGTVVEEAVDQSSTYATVFEEVAYASPTFATADEVGDAIPGGRQ